MIRSRPRGPLQRARSWLHQREGLCRRPPAAVVTQLPMSRSSRAPRRFSVGWPARLTRPSTSTGSRASAAVAVSRRPLTAAADAASEQRIERRSPPKKITSDATDLVAESAGAMTDAGTRLEPDADAAIDVTAKILHRPVLIDDRTPILSQTACPGGTFDSPWGFGIGECRSRREYVLPPTNRRKRTSQLGLPPLPPSTKLRPRLNAVCRRSRQRRQNRMPAAGIAYRRPGSRDPGWCLLVTREGCRTPAQSGGTGHPRMKVSAPRSRRRIVGCRDDRRRQRPC